MHILVQKIMSKLNRFSRVDAIQGNIDGFWDGHLQGWVRRKGNDDPLQIDILLDGKLIHRNFKSNQDRDDLIAAGISHGGFGFRVPFKLGPTDVKAKVTVCLSGQSQPILAETLNLPGKIAPQHNQLTLSFNPFQNGPLCPQSDEGLEQLKRVHKSSEADLAYIVRLEHLSDTQIIGWAVDKINPAAIFKMDLFINGDFFCEVRNDGSRKDLMRSGKSGGYGGIKQMLPRGLLRGGDLHIAFHMPDGRQVEFSANLASPPTMAIRDAPRITERVTVIVPVYNALECTKICLQRLLKYTQDDVQILVINDASTDEAIGAMLDQFGKSPAITVLTNSENLGFTGTINRGIIEAGTDDVVLLNSDARVTPRWLDGLRAAVGSDPLIATATPLSDRAGAFSAPQIGNGNCIPFGVSESEYATAVRRNSLRLYPTVPTGNGFCMYVRRACLEEIGLFDAIAFPRGYGEENDFCMRARKAGWRNVIDDATYVFHERSQSFGSEKTELMTAGRTVIDARFPDYTHSIQVFNKSPQIALARMRVAQVSHLIVGAASVLPRALFVTATASGGTPQTNRDLMLALGDAWEAWELQCDSNIIRLYRMDPSGDLKLIQYHALQEAVQPISHTSFEYDRIVAGWLVHYGFDLVHIRQLIWHSLTLPRLAKNAGSYVVNSFHDFYTLSPSINLLDKNNKFCGVTCDTEYSEQELWPNDSMPPLDPAWINIWQQRFADALAYCDAFVTTSPSARKLLLSSLPASFADRFVVIPHGRDFDDMQQCMTVPKRDEPVRILVPGNISVPKGRALIEKLLDRDAKDRRFEFHILGDHDFPTARDGLYFHGPYDRSDFAEHVHRIAPHVGAVFSIWDETYCHTLTEMWAVGLPVIGLDYPTVAGRIQASGAGWVFSDANIETLYRKMRQDLDDQVGFDAARRNVTIWQNGEGVANTTRIMAVKYQALYKSVMVTSRKLHISPDKVAYSKMTLKPRIAVVSPASKAQDAAPASTHIRTWARTKNAVDREETFVRLTPVQLLAAVQTGEIAKAIIQRNAVPADIWERLKPFVEGETLQFIFELDDDLTAVPPDKDRDGEYADYSLTLRDIICLAQVVLVTTQVLADVIYPLNKQVEVVPNRLAGPIWRGYLPDRVDDGKIRAIYMGNKTHDEDFALVQSACEAIHRKHPDFRLRLIGALSQPTSNLPDWIEIVDVPDQTRDYPAFVAFLRAQAADLDFGIAPLADTPFNASKSNLKVLDYCALGLPAIVSEHPVYNSLSGPDHIDFVKNTTADWEAAIARRIMDGQLDAETRLGIRDWVAREHLLEAELAAYDAVLRKFLSKEMK